MGQINKYSWFTACTYFVVAVLYHMWASPFWHIPITVVFAYFVISSVFLLINRSLCDFSPTHQRISIIAIIFSLLCTRGNIFAFVFSILNLLPFLTFVNIKECFQLRIFEVIRKTIAWIVGISLVAWLVSQVGFSMPYFVDFLGSFDSLWDNPYVFENHILYLVNLNLDASEAVFELPRFCAIFIEPGYFASLLAMFLYVDKYNFKHRYNIVFLSAIFFSFSLSGWILTGVGMVIHGFSSGRHRLGIIFLIAALFFGIYLIGTTYNGGDNLINTRMLSRMEYDADKGNISGYNRAAENFEDWFDSEFVFSSDAMFGISIDQYEKYITDQGIGWRYFVVRFGFIGLLVYLFFLFRQRRYFSKNVPTLGLILLYLMFFYQDGQMYLATEFTITYLMGLVLLSNKDKSYNVNS